GVQRLEDVAAGRLETAEELDDDVRAEDERLRIGGQQLARELHRARSVEVPHRDADELETGADPLGQLGTVLQELRGHLRADVAGTQERDPQVAVLDHAVAPPSRATSRAKRSSSVSPRTMSRAAPSATATTAGRAR